MKQFMTVLRCELNNYLKNKSFTVTTVLLAVLMAAIIVIPAFFLPGIISEAFGGSSETVQTSETESEQEETEKIGIFRSAEKAPDTEELSLVMPGQWMEDDSQE